MPSPDEFNRWYLLRPICLTIMHHIFHAILGLNCVCILNGVGSANSSKAKGLKMTPVAKSDDDISTIASFAENLWMKHDMARMMEGTNKELAEQIKDDMRVFVTEAQAKGGREPTLAEWAKVSIWAADTGGARDASGSAIRAQRGLWKTLFEQVRNAAACCLLLAACCLPVVTLSTSLRHLTRNLLSVQVLAQDTDQANLVRALELIYANNVAGGEPKMVRSLCYDMGHVFDDEQVRPAIHLAVDLDSAGPESSAK